MIREDIPTQERKDTRCNFILYVLLEARFATVKKKTSSNQMRESTLLAEETPPPAQSLTDRISLEDIV